MFLRFVLHNFMQMAVLQITKLTTDSGGDAGTLRQFKNFMDSAVKDEYQADYREVLKKAKFKPRIESLIKTAKYLRDREIADAVAPNRGDQACALTFDEIKEIVRELTNLFEVASFSTEYRYLIMSYDPTVVHPAGNDLARTLRNPRQHREGKLCAAPAREESDGMAPHAKEMVAAKGRAIQPLSAEVPAARSLTCSRRFAARPVVAAQDSRRPGTSSPATNRGYNACSNRHHTHRSRRWTRST